YSVVPACSFLAAALSVLRAWSGAAPLLSSLPLARTNNVCGGAGVRVWVIVLVGPPGVSVGRGVRVGPPGVMVGRRVGVELLPLLPLPLFPLLPLLPQPIKKAHAIATTKYRRMISSSEMIDLTGATGSGWCGTAVVVVTVGADVQGLRRPVSPRRRHHARRRHSHRSARTAPTDQTVAAFPPQDPNVTRAPRLLPIHSACHASRLSAINVKGGARLRVGGMERVNGGISPTRDPAEAARRPSGRRQPRPSSS